MPLNRLSAKEGDVEAIAYVNPVDVTAKEEIEAPVVRLDDRDMCEISGMNSDHHFCWDPRTVL